MRPGLARSPSSQRALRGISLDTAWLDSVVPRVAEVLGSPWQIIDYTETPPKLVSGSEAAAASGGD